MKSIFISYRRGDIGWAGRLETELQKRNSLKDRIFRDTLDILPGDHFPQRIRNALSETQIMLVLIGRTWVERIQDLNSEDDWVRIEIDYALNHDLHIIPVIFEYTKRSELSNLPESFQVLREIQDIEITDRGFEEKTKALVERIEEMLDEQKSRQLWSTLNGLRGALHIVSRNLSDKARPTFDVDNIQTLLQELGVETIDQISETPFIENFFERSQSKSQEFDLLRGVNYESWRLPSGTYLQLGANVSIREETLLMYELYDSTWSSAHLLVIVFTFHQDTKRFGEILKKIGEPIFIDRTSGKYRLPILSVFRCLMRSGDHSTRIMQSYSPVGFDTNIDMRTFVKLFDLDWIKSNLFAKSDLRKIHDYLQEEYGNYSIIHAIEYNDKQFV